MTEAKNKGSVGGGKLGKGSLFIIYGEVSFVRGGVREAGESVGRKREGG